MTPKQARQPGALAAPLARTGAIAAVGAFGVFLFLGLSGLGGVRGGWFWAAAVAATTGGLIGWWGWGARQGRTAVAAALGIAGIGFGLYMAQQSPLSHGRLRAEMDRIAVPPDFRKVDDRAGGWSMCFDVCPNLTRAWLVPGDAEEVEATAKRVFERQGFTMGEWGPDPVHGAVSAEGRRGRLRVFLTLRADRMPAGTEMVAVPAGHVSVDATLQSA
jgi:hypothetical protein